MAVRGQMGLIGALVALELREFGRRADGARAAGRVRRGVSGGSARPGPRFDDNILQLPFECCAADVAAAAASIELSGRATQLRVASPRRSGEGRHAPPQCPSPSHFRMPYACSGHCAISVRPAHFELLACARAARWTQGCVRGSCYGS